jgi:hypothetical protein
MKQTIPFKFPYPECAPPLVKDAPDIAQLRDLAEAVDAVMDDLEAEAGDLRISPDAAIMTNTAAQVFAVDQTKITFNTVEFDNTPGGALLDLAGNRFAIQQTGHYLITIGFRVAAASTGFAAVSFDVNGLLSNSHGQGVGSATIEAAIGVMTVRALTAGDLVQFQYSGTIATPTLNSARAGIFRIV